MTRKCHNRLTFSCIAVEGYACAHHDSHDVVGWVSMWHDCPNDDKTKHTAAHYIRLRFRATTDQRFSNLECPSNNDDTISKATSFFTKFSLIMVWDKRKRLMTFYRPTYLFLRHMQDGFYKLKSLIAFFSAGPAPRDDIYQPLSCGPTSARRASTFVNIPTNCPNERTSAQAR